MSITASILARSIASERPGGLLNRRRLCDVILDTQRRGRCRQKIGRHHEATSGASRIPSGAARSAPQECYAHHAIFITLWCSRIEPSRSQGRVHLVEPEQRNRTPGVVDRFHIHFCQPDEIICTRIRSQQRKLPRRLAA